MSTPLNGSRRPHAASVPLVGARTGLPLPRGIESAPLMKYGFGIADRQGNSYSTEENDDCWTSCPVPQDLDYTRREPEYLALMQNMKMDGLRSSTAWARLLPNGKGRPDQKVLTELERSVDRQLEAGIEPMLTLNHWDMPRV